MNDKDVLVLQNVSFNYGKNQILKNFNLNVQKGTFTTLLGPSGCGKTTILRLISGFLSPSSGEIFINGKNQQNVPVNERKVGIVFQDYALFPHLTVEKNILYGLKYFQNFQIENRGSKNLRAGNLAKNLAENCGTDWASFENGAGKAQNYKKNPLLARFKNCKTNHTISKEMQQALLHQMARMLAIEGLLERFPHQLSGGQQQRVALARSLILKPQILLMDEPLSSLDAKLRSQVRDELLEIQNNFGITTIYVTHDQEEAFSLSNKIAVINHGQKLQEGTSPKLYFEPKNRFVAEFTGKCNFLLLNSEDFSQNKAGNVIENCGEKSVISGCADFEDNSVPAVCANFEDFNKIVASGEIEDFSVPVASTENAENSVILGCGEDLKNISNEKNSKTNALYLVRPEWFELADGENFQIEGEIFSITFMGSFIRLKIKSKISQNNFIFADINSSNCPTLLVGSKIKLNIKHFHLMEE